MNEDIAPPLLECFERLQSGQARLEYRLEALSGRVARLESSCAVLLRDLPRAARTAASADARVDHVECRLGRLECALQQPRE